MKIQIIIRYLKSGQEALPGVRASAWAAKAAVPRTRPSWEGLGDTPIGILLSSVLHKCGHFWQLNKNFNSRSTLWNSTLIHPEDISSSSPVVPHYTGTECVISRRQKTGATNTPPPLRNECLMLEFCGDGQSVFLLFLFLFDRRGRGVNGREDEIKLNSISLTELKLLCVIF